MAKVKEIAKGCYSFFCPGCGHEHVYYVNPENYSGPRWTFNGDINNPTFSPSLLNRWGKEADPSCEQPEGQGPENTGWSGRCHLFVQNGVINYCGDCTHSYNGKTNVSMKEYQ